jgi:hypothetical protein
MLNEHDPNQQASAKGEQLSPLAHSSLPRRDFLRQLSALLSSGSKVSRLAAVIEQTSAPAADTAIERFREIKDVIEQYISSDIAIRKRIDPFKLFHLARQVIAKEFVIDEDIVTIGRGRAERVVAELLRDEQVFLSDALDIRSTSLAYLHANRATLVDFVENLFGKSELIDLGHLSAALAHENINVDSETIRRIVSSENNEIRYLFNESLVGVSNAAINTTNLYETPNGVKIYRQMDQSFKLSADKKRDEAYRKANKNKLAHISLPENAHMYSPEMYRYSALPPSRFSLQVEHPRFQNELYKVFNSRMEELFAREQIPLAIRNLFAKCQIDSILSPASEKAKSYLALLEYLHDDIPAEYLIGRPLMKWILNPRATLAAEVITPYAALMGKINFDSLKETSSFFGIEFKNHTLTSFWLGPFKQQKESKIFHDLLGESVSELIRENKLFFCNLPIANLAQFKNYSTVDRFSSHFAEMFLPVFDRMLLKKVNINAFLMGN